MRVIVLEFLDTDVFNISVESCDSFLDPLIESWDIDLATFAMEITLNRRLAPGHSRKFAFVEKDAEWPSGEEPGFQRFLRDGLLSGNATEKELSFLRNLRFNGKRPTPLYYYRELQNLRDPLHFRADPVRLQKHRDTQTNGKQRLRAGSAQQHAAGNKAGRSIKKRKFNTAN
jgi:hypothetical protein